MVVELAGKSPAGASKDGLGGRRRRGVGARNKAKEGVVGAGARVLFYPTLLYNVLRSKLQAEFRWWDEVDQFLLLGAVPFPRDVPRLQQLGVHGVVTLNEPFETLVPASMYQSRGIAHLVIPTRDYLFSPSLVDITQAIDFIHRNAASGKTTYVHCKAGRGRSTTIVLCYLVKYKNMTPAAAFEYVRSKRPRVLLTRSQWRVVQDFSRNNAEHPTIAIHSEESSPVGDAALITEAKEIAAGDVNFSSHATAPSRPMRKMLSCLFAFSKGSGGSSLVGRRLPKVRVLRASKT